MNSNYNFISNNVKGIKASEKRLKLFEYLRNKINNNGFVFLQETYSSLKDEQKWIDHFNGPLFFSHGKNNSCGVSIGYCGTETIEVINTACDKYGQILILDPRLNHTNFLLINFYNSNSESEQLSTFSSPQKLLVKFDYFTKTNVVFEVILIFDQKFDVTGGNTILKKKSIAKLIEIKEPLFLSDIWRIRNPNVRGFTFRQNHASGFIERRLDFFF